MRKIRDNVYFKCGLTAFLTLAAAILFYLSTRHIGDLSKLVPKFMDVLTPFIIGFVIAYLLTPLYNGMVRRIRFRMLAKGKSEEVTMRVAKLSSLVLSFLIFMLIISFVLYLVLPELVNTFKELVVTLPVAFDKIIAWMQAKAEIYQLWGPIEKVFQNGNEKLISWMTSKLLPASMTMVDGISTGIMELVSVFLDLIVGIVAAIYMLASKDTFAAQGKKLTYCIFSSETAGKIKRGAKIVNDTFMRFVSSNLIDGIIVGVITGVFMTIMGWEYAMLIAVIVGITNLIPFFGPFIGAVPSIALLLMANPIHALYFAIFVVVLQQIDGNIIKPKLFGEGVGLSSFWVMFAIIVGGGLFGFLGMLLAVPVFAVLYQYLNYRMDMKLRKHAMSYNIDDYMDKDFYEMREAKVKSRLQKIVQHIKGKNDKGNNSEDDN